MISYQRFKAIPVINKRFSGRSDIVEHFGGPLDPEKKFSNKFNIVVYVCSMCHSFSKLLLGFKFPRRAFRSLTELSEEIEKPLINDKFNHQSSTYMLCRFE